ncbi:MAG TPA: SusE domain-containing protein [Flavisolibacter sp.]
MKKIFLFVIAAAGLFAGCKKTDFDDTVTGEALGPFRILSPASGTSLLLNSATPGATVQISWTASKPGVSKQPTYTWIAANRTGGNLDQPLIQIPSDNNGNATTLTLTQRQLDSVLAAKGIAVNATADLMWSVVSDNGSTKLRSDDVFNISIRRMGDGVSPFKLFGPVSSTTSLEINPTSTSDTIHFVWQKALPGNIANPVTYKVVFAPEGAGFANPLFTITSGNSGADTTAHVTYKQISDSLLAHGYTDFSQIAKLDWTVMATSGTFTMQSDYTNTLYIVRLVRMYLVGSINGWNINAPFEMIADKGPGRLGRVFYTYIRLSASDEFKFAKTPGDWNSAYGVTGVVGGGFSTAMNQGGNFGVQSGGVYRLTIDLGVSMVYIQQKEVGLVGSLQGWNPASPVYGNLFARNRFIIITNMSSSDEFKFHDGPAWDNSTADKARWWGKGPADGLLDNDGNGANISNNTGATRVRAIWDGQDPQQVKYDLSGAAEMRVVGDGIQGVNAWDPGASPQMTYLGSGQWQITLTLIGGKDIKFLAGNAWGAFDYEDASGGSTATGTPRAIRWEGGSNFKTPSTTGSYTILLDEYTQTVTIN